MLLGDYLKLDYMMLFVIRLHLQCQQIKLRITSTTRTTNERKIERLNYMMVYDNMKRIFIFFYSKIKKKTKIQKQQQQPKKPPQNPKKKNKTTFRLLIIGFFFSFPLTTLLTKLQLVIAS